MSNMVGLSHAAHAPVPGGLSGGIAASGSMMARALGDGPRNMLLRTSRLVALDALDRANSGGRDRGDLDKDKKNLAC